MNPFASALSAYHAGDASASFTIRRDDGFEQNVPAVVFFSGDDFPPMEAIALDKCRGRVLDVGAAAGRHSLSLLRKGLEVTALDILPEMESILRDRGIADVVISDIRRYKGPPFDTLLMLMNGIGMVGNPAELDRFLTNAHSLVKPDGQIICDSIDVMVTTDPTHVAYREKNLAVGRSPGQQAFTIMYKKLPGEPFEWLHVGFDDLSNAALKAGWQTDLIEQQANGHFLAKLTKL